MKKRKPKLFLNLKLLAKKYIFAIIIIFVILSAMFFRWKNIFAYKVMTHEWNYATVLTTLEIWNDVGIATYSFNPIMTRPDGADKFINNNASNEEGRLYYEDEAGNTFYTSYPQFGIIAPYLIFKLLGLPPEVIPLRLLNIIVQIATALIIFRIIFEATNKKILALVGFISYMYLPSSFVYHVYNYMSDMLVQLFFVANLYFLLRIIRNTSHKSLNLTSFAIGLLLMIYTDWFGLCFSGVVFLLALFKRKESYARPLLWISFLSPILIVALSVWQYSLSVNLDSFLVVMVDRYSNSYGSYSVFDLEAYSRIIDSYIYWYKPALYLIGISLFAFLINRLSLKKYKSSHLPEAPFILLISILPVLVHHLLFLNWTVFHGDYFSSLKLAVFLSFLIAFIFHYLLYELKADSRKTIIFIVSTVFFLASVDALNVYKDQLKEIPEYESSYSYCDAGLEISLHSSKDEVIFIKDSKGGKHHFPVNPIIPLCAKRNVEIYSSYYEALVLMQKNGVYKASVFTLTYLKDNSVYVTDKETINLLDFGESDSGL